MPQTRTGTRAAGVFLSACALLNDAHVSASSFHFSAKAGGWQVDAHSGNATDSEDDHIKLTWLDTNMAWTAALPRVAPLTRTSIVRNGCWKHSTKAEKPSFSSSAELTNGKVLDDGSISLTGIMLVQKLNDTAQTQQSIPWQLMLMPNKAGALDFNVTMQFPSDGIPSIAPWDKRKGTETYRFFSVDVSLDWKLVDTEKIVGAGEQYSMASLRGESFYIWTAEQGIGRGLQPITETLNLGCNPCGGDTHTTYSAAPVFLSTRGYGLALHNLQLTYADFTDPLLGTMTVAFEASDGNVAPRVSGRLWAAKDIRSLLHGLGDLTGRMSAPPAWTQEGLVVGDEGGHEIVQQHVDALLAAKVPVAGVWIQDWSGKINTANGEIVWWNWVLDEDRYPKQWFRNMSARGIKVLTYVNSFLTDANGTQGKVSTVYEEAMRLGHLVADKNGDALIQKAVFAPINFGIIDVFKPEAREWWTNLIKCNIMMACDGEEPLVHGWMHDYGEYYPLSGAVRAGGPQGLASDLHNLYPEYYQSTARAATEGFPDVTFFSRSGGLRSPGVTKMFWAGDQLTSYDACDGLQSALIGIMTGGFSGWTVNHADIGAFTMIDRAKYLPLPGIHFKRDSELNVRWLELTVFINSMYRAHPGLIPESSSQVWDDEVVVHTRAMAELFRDLTPYRQSLFVDAEKFSLPLVRHGLLVEPNDETWFNASASYKQNHCYGNKQNTPHPGNEVGLFQFYFGDDVIVAPALNRNVDQVFAYIPKGDSWISFWANKEVVGPSYNAYDAPLGRPVFFFRASSTWAPFFRKLQQRHAHHLSSGLQAVLV